jgi:hypothetical protein
MNVSFIDGYNKNIDLLQLTEHIYYMKLF